MNSLETQAYIEQLGQRVRQLRERKGLTQAQLGEVCNMEVANISKLEAGDINSTFSTVVLIAQVLGVKTGDLFLD